MPDDLETALRRWLIAAARDQAADPEPVIFSESLADDLQAAGVTYGLGELTAILQALAAQQCAAHPTVRRWAARQPKDRARSAGGIHKYSFRTP